MISYIYISRSKNFIVIRLFTVSIKTIVLISKYVFERIIFVSKLGLINDVRNKKILFCRGRKLESFLLLATSRNKPTHV